MDDFLFDEETHKTANGMDPVTLPASRQSSGQGFIVLNTNQERDVYITNCYRTNTVMILTTNREIVKNCIVPADVWNRIVFPEDNDDLGSMVSWLNILEQGSVVIIDVLVKKQEHIMRTESQYIEELITKDAFFKTIGDALKGSYDVIVGGNSEDAAKIDFRALNPNVTALLNAYIQGKIKFEADKDILLKALVGITFNVKDEKSPDKNTVIEYIMDEGFTYVDQFKNKLTINKDGIKIEDLNGNIIQTIQAGISIKNKQTSLRKVLTKIMTTYMATKTIDGKPLDPKSLQKAGETIQEITKLLI